MSQFLRSAKIKFYEMTSEVGSRSGHPGFDLAISSRNGSGKEQRYKSLSLKSFGAKQCVKKEKSNIKSKEHIPTKDFQRPSRRASRNAAASAAPAAGNAAATAWADNCPFSADRSKTFKRPSSIPEVASLSADVGGHEHDDHGKTYKRPSNSRLAPKAIAASAAGKCGQHCLIRIS